MTASAPSCSPSRYRGRFSTEPAAIRRKHASIATTASAGERSSATSASVTYNGMPEVWHPALLPSLAHGERDLAPGAQARARLRVLRDDVPLLRLRMDLLDLPHAAVSAGKSLLGRAEL